MVGSGGGEDPAEDADGEDEEGEGEDDLAGHVEFVPEGAVGHFLAMGVSEGFCEGSAGADPAAVGSFPPSPDDEGDDDEGLHEAEDEPAPHGCLGEEVKDE